METGTLNPVLSNPDEYFAIGNLPVEELIAKFESEYEHFKMAKSVLPDEPDWNGLNAIINRIRMYN